MPRGADGRFVSVGVTVNDQASRKLDQLGARFTKLERGGRKLAGGLGVAFGAKAVIGGIVKSIDLAKNYDLTIRQVGVQTGQTGVQLKGLSSLALKMGQDTVYSAQDAAGAMLELAKGGLTAAQIKSGALATTMQLAAAGGVELGDAASYVTQGMNTYHLAASQAGQVSTALAGGANASTASVTSLGMALSQVGPGAVNAGMSIQETVAALSAFDNAGIKGSDAGTSLKTMLARLVPQTDKARQKMEDLGISFVKPNGQFKSMSQVAQILHNKLGPLTQAQRAQALQTMFGSDATRAATVLMNNGAKGLAHYIAATKNQHTVQKMANTTMTGASGAWENFTGSVETAAIQLGTKMLPTVTKVLNQGSDFVKEAMTWGPGLKDTFGPVAKDAKDLAQAMGPLVQLGGGLLRTVGQLPGPVKTFGIELGLAALVLPRVTSGVGAFTSSLSAGRSGLSGYVTGLASAETRMSTIRMSMQTLTPAAKALAGTGGLMAVTAASHQTSRGLSVLEAAGGGAALGFSVGGPWGAAIGGGAGALYGLLRSTKATSDGLTKAKQPTLDYASTLNQVSLAATKATRSTAAMALQQSGALAAGQRLGVNTRDMVSASLGNAKAIDRVNAALGRAAYAGGNFTKGMSGAKDLSKVQNSIAGVTSSLNHQRDALRQQQVAIGGMISKLGGIPKSKAVKIETLGTKPAIDDFARLANRIHLTPKQIRIAMKADGAGFTLKQVQQVQTALKGTGKQKANLLPYVQSINAGGSQAKGAASKGAKGVGDALKTGTKTRANMAPWLASIRSGTSTARGIAAVQSPAVGASLKNGILSGFAGTQALLAAQAAAAVRGAIAAAKAAGDSHSPSRKMMRVGKDLGDGAWIGLKSRNQLLTQAGANLVASLVGGVRKKRVSFSDAMDALKSEVSKRTDALNESIGRRDDLAAGISGMGTSLFAGSGDDKATTINSLLAQGQLNVNSAKQTEGDVASVIGKGMSMELIKQLSANGSSGAAALHALAGASTAQIGQINGMDAAATAALQRAGAQAGQTVYGSEVSQATSYAQQAQVLVDALNAAGVGNNNIYIQLDGRTIEVSQKKQDRKQGRQPAKGKGK